MNFLATYTWSKVLSDAHDLLNGGSAGNSVGGNINGYRAPSIPGFGIKGDYALAPFDIRNVVHFSGGYELPVGKGKRYMGHGGLSDTLLGGWAVNWTATLQGGQPLTIPCSSSGTAASTACNAIVVGDPKRGLHVDSQGFPNLFANASAFNQPCNLGGSVGATAPIADKPFTGCIPLNGLDALGGGPTQFAGPGFHRLDMSFFKNFQINERFRLQFRSEFFNIFNHPNFNAPGFGGNGVVARSGSIDFRSVNFGEIGSTRDAPYDPRQIQFALKLYY